MCGYHLTESEFRLFKSTHTKYFCQKVLTIVGKIPNLLNGVWLAFLESLPSPFYGIGLTLKLSHISAFCLTTYHLEGGLLLVLVLQTNRHFVFTKDLTFESGAVADY